MKIQDKVALVTGGGSGIGRATALRLAQEGAAVVVADVDDAGGHETVRLIEAAASTSSGQSGGRSAFVRSDVTKEADARAMVAFAEKTFGGLDILHNNAGVTTGRPRYPDAQLERWMRVLETNLIGVVLGTHYGIEAMRKRGGGAIVNTASMAGLAGWPADPVYAASKGGVVFFTRSLANLKDEMNIRVNCVCPGVVDTPLLTRVRDALPEAERARLVGAMASFPMLSAEEIADAVVEFVRDDSLAGLAMRIEVGRPRELVELPTLRAPRS